MSQSIQIMVVIPPFFTVSFRRDNNLHPCSNGIGKDLIGIVANRVPADIPSIRWIASLQSARVPSVISTLTGIPFASTARWILVLSPLLYDPYPGFHLSLQRHEDVPCNGLRQSWAIQSQVHPPEFPTTFPTCPCPAICETADIQYPISHSTVVGLAMGLLCVKSRTPRW